MNLYHILSGRSVPVLFLSELPTASIAPAKAPEGEMKSLARPDLT